MFLKRQRKHFYKTSEEILDVKSILGKWKDPSLNEINQHIQELLEMNFLAVRNRLVRHESRLQDLRFVKFSSYRLLLEFRNVAFKMIYE